MDSHVRDIVLRATDATCLCREAGAVASDIDGRPMQLNRPDSTFMNHRGLLFAGNIQLAEQIKSLFASRKGSQPT